MWDFFCNFVALIMRAGFDALTKDTFSQLLKTIKNYSLIL